ncbi:MAG: gamma-glutamyltransferase, partial [Verrucomicrobia bacterium]|nr:gamma-glutamyltransferase [Verrucomicrobiota bacterium]
MKQWLLIFGLAIVSGMAGNSAMAADRLTGAPFATRSEVLATNGMVATSQPLAVQAGVRILREGGNA